SFLLTLCCSIPYCCFFFVPLPPPLLSTLFPYTTLFRSVILIIFPVKTTLKQKKQKDMICLHNTGMLQPFRHWNNPKSIWKNWTGIVPVFISAPEPAVCKHC